MRYNFCIYLEVCLADQRQNLLAEATKFLATSFMTPLIFERMPKPPVTKQSLTLKYGDRACFPLYAIPLRHQMS